MSEQSLDVKTVEKNTVVLISYSIFNKEGRVLEARTPDDPVQFLVGHGQILKALEEEILGQTEGFKGDFLFKAKDAHGDYKKELVIEMQRGQFPKDMEIKKGMKFESKDPSGKVMALHVLDIKDDVVLVDGNHPLAGEDLRFDITILSVRPAAKEELRRGQVLSHLEPDSKTVH